MAHRYSLRSRAKSNAAQQDNAVSQPRGIVNKAYPLPTKSVTETARLNRQHEVFKVRWNGIHKIPLSSTHPPRRILDLGCGTGIWCTEMAQQFPSAQVIGLDLSLPAERYETGSVPPNCHFYKADVTTAAWDFLTADEPFDVISIRMLLAAVRDWDGMFERCFAALRPGGYLQVFEGAFEMLAKDARTAQRSAAVRYFDLAKDYMAGVGMQWDVVVSFAERLRAVGLEVTVDEVKKMKLYPDEADPMVSRNETAHQYAVDMAEMVGGMSKRMFSHPSSTLTESQGETLAAQAEKEMTQQAASKGLFTHLYIRVARKPAV